MGQKNRPPPTENRRRAPWDCKSKSSPPAPAARLLQPSTPLCGCGPMLSSSLPIPFSPPGVSNWCIWRRSREEIAELIGVTVGSLQDTCSRFGIGLLSNGMGLLRRGGRHSDNGTSTYTGSRGGDVPLPPINGQSQQNSQSGPVEQPQATTRRAGENG